MFQARAGALDESLSGRGEASVEETVRFVDDEVCDAGEDVGVAFGDAVEEMGGCDYEVDAGGCEEPRADHLAAYGGGEEGGTEFDGMREGSGEGADLVDEFGGGEEDYGSRAGGVFVGGGGGGEVEDAVVV